VCHPIASIVVDRSIAARFRHGLHLARTRRAGGGRGRLRWRWRWGKGDRPVLKQQAMPVGKRGGGGKMLFFENWERGSDGRCEWSKWKWERRRWGTYGSVCIATVAKIT
jgi:hypothetical protein